MIQRKEAKVDVHKMLTQKEDCYKGAASSPSKFLDKPSGKAEREGGGERVLETEERVYSDTKPLPRRTHNRPDLKALRRELRTNGTPAEGALWNLLKGKKIAGLQFRRQFSIGRCILDFYCPALRLAIELDGECHYNIVNSAHDLERDEMLFQQEGIRTLRFENRIVFEHPENIINNILAVLEERGERHNHELNVI